MSEVSKGLTRERESRIAPLRAQTLLEAPQQAFDFALRGASEAGRSMSSATDFLRGITTLGKTQSFAGQESALNRLFQQNQNNQMIALQLAMMGQKSQGPTALDYFLQYGLPTIGTVAGGYAGKK